MGQHVSSLVQVVSARGPVKGVHAPLELFQVASQKEGPHPAASAKGERLFVTVLFNSKLQSEIHDRVILYASV